MNEMKELYKADSIKYNQAEAEVKAAELLKQVENLYAIKKITRQNSYDAGHTGETNSRAETLTEKLLAIALFNSKKEYEHIGKIFDYEVPLKDSNEDKGVGKIDLVAKNDNIVTLLELKVENSKETLLRCVLEVFTYWKILDHEKFLQDFKLSQDTIIKKAVLVFENSTACSQYKDKKNSVNTLALMEKLDVELFVLKNIDEDNYKVTKPCSMD